MRRDEARPVLGRLMSLSSSGSWLSGQMFCFAFLGFGLSVPLQAASITQQHKAHKLQGSTTALIKLRSQYNTDRGSESLISQLLGGEILNYWISILDSVTGFKMTTYAADIDLILPLQVKIRGCIQYVNAYRISSRVHQ